MIHSPTLWVWFKIATALQLMTLQLHHNERHGISDHQRLIVYSGANQRKHQSSTSLVFLRGIHPWPVDFPHKWPVTRKMFPFDDVIVKQFAHIWHLPAASVHGGMFLTPIPTPNQRYIYTICIILNREKYKSSIACPLDLLWLCVLCFCNNSCLMGKIPDYIQVLSRTLNYNSVGRYLSAEYAGSVYSMHV